MDKTVTGESIYRYKTRLVQEMEYSSNFEILSKQLIEWGKDKPDNKTLKDLAYALAKIGLYVSNLQMETESFEKIVSQYRKDKLKYQQDAYESAQKLASYEDKYFGKDK